MRLSAVIRKEDDLYTAWCPELDVASQGPTVEEAVANLTEAVELYLEDEDADHVQGIPLITSIEVEHDEASRSVRA